MVDFLAAISSRPIVSRGIEVEADDEFQEYKELGFGLCYESGVLHQVALHSGLGDSSYARYERELIHGVVFGYSEDDVRQEMGSPVFEGGGIAGSLARFSAGSSTSGEAIPSTSNSGRWARACRRLLLAWSDG